MKRIAFALTATLALAAAPASFAQGPAVGQILVSSPELADPNFAQSVLLILFHEDDIGTAAVMINRPTWVDPQQTFPEIPALANYEGPLYLGGPVAPTDVWTVLEAQAVAEFEEVRPITSSLAASMGTDILAALDLTAVGAPRVRIFAGHAEWGPGQLARELQQNNWRLLPARPEYVFSSDPADLWNSLPQTASFVTASLD